MGELCLKEDFNVRYINSLYQNWQNTRRFCCFEKPKKEHLFLYLENLSIRYTDHRGREYLARSGQVVYTPQGSRYRAELFDFQGEKPHTVGINFLLYDSAGKPFGLSDEITVLPQVPAHTAALFHRAVLREGVATPLQKRILLMELISALTEEVPVTAAHPEIAHALSYLAEHIEENPSVARLAETCGMSQVYFRKCFRQATGMSPVAYRSHLRLRRAATYLEYGQISVQEISDALGYATVSHFIKAFKDAYGVSPLQYRRNGEG